MRSYRQVRPVSGAPQSTLVNNKAASKKQSRMSTFTADVEFIQFLKSISMFVTDDQGTIGL